MLMNQGNMKGRVLGSSLVILVHYFVHRLIYTLYNALPFCIWRWQNLETGLSGHCIVAERCFLLRREEVLLLLYIRYESKLYSG